MESLKNFCDNPSRESFNQISPEYKLLLVSISVDILSEIYDNFTGWDMDATGNWVYNRNDPKSIAEAADWDVFLMSKIVRYNGLTDKIPDDVRRGYKALLTGLQLLLNAGSKLVLSVNFVDVGGSLEIKVVDINGSTRINVEEELSIMQGQKSLVFNSYEESKEYLTDMFRTEHLNINKMYMTLPTAGKKLFYDKNIGIVFNKEASECLKCLQKIFKLGLGKYCTKDDCTSVKAKIKKCLKKYHPDKQVGSDGKLTKESEEKFHLAKYILQNCKSVTDGNCQNEIRNAPKTWREEDIENL